MRVLFIYSFLRQGSNAQWFNIALDAAFKKSNWDYHTFEYADKMRSGSKDDVNAELIAYVKSISPEVVFLQYIDAGDIFVSTTKEISKYSKIIIWSGDMYQSKLMNWVFDYAPYVTSLFSNMDYINELREKGYKAEFMNHYAQDMYYPYQTEKNYPITFIGSHYDRYPLSGERYEAIKFLSDTYKGKFHLWGNSWGAIPNHGFLDRARNNEILNKSIISINYSNLSSSRYTSDRLQHIMGSGCFCLCKRFPDAEIDLGKDGELVRFFDTAGEAKELIDYYLIHEKEREDIALRGCNAVKDIYGDNNLLRTIEKMYSGAVEK